MVFGHKCAECGKDANVHHQERDKGVIVVDEWLCYSCSDPCWGKDCRKCNDLNCPMHPKNR